MLVKCLFKKPILTKLIKILKTTKSCIFTVYILKWHCIYYVYILVAT